MTNHTTYITADAFRDRYALTPVGETFTYATGDLASACQYDEDARALRALTFAMAEQRQIVLTQRRRPDLPMKQGAASFEYRATKRAATTDGVQAPQIDQARPQKDRSKYGSKDYPL